MKLKIFFAFVAVLLAGVWWQLDRQGLSIDEFQAEFGDQVRFDPMGIPTIKGKDWLEVYERQGFVVASERMWQMDLIRRKAAGELSELIGKRGFAHDVEKVTEDRRAVARAAVELISDEELNFCNAFAQGVNRFIEGYPGRWGIEYFLLRTEPKPWTCIDTTLVLMAMGDDLSTSSRSDSYVHYWSQYLSPEWHHFLFSRIHPWNTPLIGEPKHSVAPLPPKDQHIPMQPVMAEDTAVLVDHQDGALGSNSWAYRGRNGAFLANDPHLGNSVPQIWYALRLWVSKEDWVVGVALPGISGVVLGMNPHISWSFTNTCEDVDDLVEEVLSDDGSQYKDRDKSGQEVWRPVIRKPYLVAVQGEEEPRRVMGLFTHRGPLKQYSYLGDRWFSRQWIGLNPNVLRAAVNPLNRATSLVEYNKNVDGLAFPTQNIVLMDRQGAIALRISGTGVDRPLDGYGIQPAIEGEWRGLEPRSTRPHKFYDKEPLHQYIATANQRIYPDDEQHFWYADDRAERIKAVLGTSDAMTQEDMERLHLDTHSRIRKLLLAWIAKHSSLRVQPLKQKSLWSTWDGDSKSNQELFMIGDIALDGFAELLLGRVKRVLMKDAEHDVRFAGLERILITRMVENPATLVPFGLRSEDVADYLVRLVKSKRPLPNYPSHNAVSAQHPFADAIPVLGRIFAVPRIAQWGASDTVNAQTPGWGPSVRMLWNMSAPQESTWVLPVGQSGHVMSKHYYDFQRRWAKDLRVKVFDRPEEFGF